MVSELIFLPVDGYIMVGTVDNIDYDQISSSSIYGWPRELPVYRQHCLVGA